MDGSPVGNDNIDSIVLEEEIDPNYVPSENEVIEYAKWLGMDLEADKDLFWIAREGLMAPLPNNWKPCKTKDTEDIYYFNFATGESTWDHPCDGYYKRTYEEEKKKKETINKANSDMKRQQAKQTAQELLGKNEKKARTKSKSPISTPTSSSNKKLELNPVLERKLPLPTLLPSRTKGEMSEQAEQSQQPPQTLLQPHPLETKRPLSAPTLSSDAKPIGSFVKLDSKNESSINNNYYTESKESTPRSSIASFPVSLTDTTQQSNPNSIDKKAQRNFLSQKGFENNNLKIGGSDHPNLLTPPPTPQHRKNNSSAADDQDSNSLSLTRLQEDNQQLQYKIAFHEMELKKSKAELETMKSLENELSRYKRELNFKEQEIVYLKTDKRSLEIENKKLEDSSMDYRREISSMKSNYDTLKKENESEIRKLNNILSQKDSDILKLRNSNQELSAQMEKTSSQNGGGSENSSSPRRTNSTSSMGSLAVDELKARISFLEHDNRKIQQELAEKSSLLNEYSSASGVKQSDLTAKLNEDLANLKSSNETKLKQLETEKQDLVQQLQVIKDQQRTVSIDSSSVNQIQSLQMKINTVEHEKTSLLSEISHLKSDNQRQLVSHNHEVQESKNTLQQSLEKIQFLEQEKSDFAQQLRKLSDIERKYSDIENRFNESQRENGTLANKITLKGEEIQLLKDKLDFTHLQLCALKNQQQSPSSSSSDDVVNNNTASYISSLEDQLKQTQENMQQDIQSKNEKIMYLTELYQKKETEILELKSKQAELEHSLLRAQESETSVLQLLNTYQLKNHQLSQQTEQLKSSIEEKVRTQNYNNEELERERDKIINELEQLKLDFSSLQQKDQQVNQDFQALNEAHSQLISFSEQQETMIQQHLSAIAQLKNTSSQRDSLKGDSDQLSAITELTNENKRLESEILRTKQTIIENQEMYALKEREINEWKQKYELLETKLKSHLSDVSSSQTSQQHLLNEKLLLIHELNCKLELLSNNHRLDSSKFDSTLQSKEKEIKDCLAQIQQLTMQNNDFTIQSFASETEKKRLMNEHDNKIKLFETLMTSKEQEISSLQLEFERQSDEMRSKFQDQLQNLKNIQKLEVSSSNADSTNNHLKENIANIELTTKVVSLESEQEKLQYDRIKHLKMIENLKEEIDTLNRSVRTANEEKETQIEQNKQLKRQAHQLNDEIGLKDKRIKGFTEELLQVQKKLDEQRNNASSQNLHSHIASTAHRHVVINHSTSVQTEVLSSDIEKWKKAFSEREQVIIKDSSSLTNSLPNDLHRGLEEHLQLIKTELEDRKREFQLLFQLLSNNAVKVGIQKNPTKDNAMDEEERLMMLQEKENSNQKPQLKQKIVSHSAAVNAIHKNQKNKKHLILDSKEANEDSSTEEGFNSDELESIAEIPLTVPFRHKSFSPWTLETILDFFDHFNDRLKSLNSSLRRRDDRLRKRFASSTNDENEFKIALQTRVSKEEKFKNSFKILVESLKSFINQGRKDIKTLKEHLSSFPQQRHQSFQNEGNTSRKVRDHINSLTIAMNLLIRFARSIQDFETKRTQLLVKLVECTSQKNSQSILDQLSNEFKILLQESTDVTSQLIAAAESDGAERNKHHFAQPPQYSVSPNENIFPYYSNHLNQNNYMLQSVHHDQPAMQPFPQPPHPHSLTNNLNTRFLPIPPEGNGKTDITMELGQLNRKMVNNYNSINQYQQRSVAISQELDHFRLKQLHSFQEIDRHKSWLDNLLKEVNNPWSDQRKDNLPDFDSLLPPSKKMKEQRAAPAILRTSEIQTPPFRKIEDDKFQRELFFV